jgi:hypothetical protein
MALTRLEKQILISKFIGHRKPMSYDTDWNHLIPVVRTILSIETEHRIYPIKDIINGLISTDIEKVFNYTVLAIENFKNKTR